MRERPNLRRALDAVRRHVERGAAGTGLQPTRMSVELRFGLETDEAERVVPVLSTAGAEAAPSPHSLRAVLDLED